MRTEQIVALVTEADEELRAAVQRADQQRVEIHQLTNRLNRAQDENRRLEDRVAELELAAQQAATRADSAVAATLAHTARTT